MVNERAEKLNTEWLKEFQGSEILEEELTDRFKESGRGSSH
ncbi:hypothetical protein [Peribacillus simplex]